MTLPEIIKTERLTLRPFRFTDVDDVFGYATNPEWSKYLPVPVPYTYHHAEQFIATRKLSDPAKEKVWAIELNESVVGGISLRNKAGEFAICELGWSIAQPHWGKGLMTEVVRTIRDTAFSKLPTLHRLRAGADLRNVGSWRVMEKIGMQREALFRQDTQLRGEWTDNVWYAILRPFTLRDAADVFDYATDPEWGRFLPVPDPYTFSDAETFIALCLLRDPKKARAWAIESVGKAIGCVELHFQNEQQAIGEMHWSISQAHWGKGMMTEAAAAERNTTISTCVS